MDFEPHLGETERGRPGGLGARAENTWGSYGMAKQVNATQM